MSMRLIKVSIPSAFLNCRSPGQGESYAELELFRKNVGLLGLPES